MDFKKPLKFIPNIRFSKPGAEQGYNWGKNVKDSNILKMLGWLDTRGSDFVLNNEALAKQGIEENDAIAERWIVSDDAEYPSKVLLSSKSIMDLPVLFSEYTEALLGKKHMERHGMYLGSLMKIVDTSADPKKGSHSIQVHPKSGYSALPSKFEMWKGHGRVYIGWKQEMTPEAVLDACKQMTLEQCLNQADLDSVKYIRVDGGIVHAIRFDSYISEWSKAPDLSDHDKGTLRNAVVALFDRTDGKKARIEKENIQKALDVLQHADTFRACTDFISHPREIFSDKEGNRLKHIFETPSLVVQEYSIATSYKLDLSERGFPFFLEKGTLEVLKNGKIVDLIHSGEERFLPSCLNEITFVNKYHVPAVFQTWFIPL